MGELQAQIICNEDLRGAERYAADEGAEALVPVSYTHLTLPTKA